METTFISNDQLESILQAEELSKKVDPEDNPYASKYEARTLWQGILEHIESQPIQPKREENGPLNNLSFPPHVLYHSLRMAVLYKLSLIFFETSEMSEALRQLDAAFDLPLSIDELTSPLVIASYLSCLNSKAIILSELDRHQEAKNVLCQGLDLHADFMQNRSVDGTFKDEDLPLDTNKLFGFAVDHNLSGLLSMEGKRESIIDNFDQLYTLALYYMAQVCRNLNQIEEAASFCQDTLERQIKRKDLDRDDWARNCATLSQYYLTKDNFPHARHCLATAQVVAEDLHASVEGEPPGEKGDGGRVDTARRCAADVARCWANYAIILLEASKETLCKPEDQAIVEEVKDEMPFNPFHLESGVDARRSELEASVSATLVHGFDTARPVFLKAQTWLNQSKTYYTIDEFCSDYIEIIRDLSRLFKVLSFFDPDGGRKCKMHKRRVDMLAELLAELNRDFYLSAARQLLFELGETTNEMLNIKLDAVNETQSAELSEHQLQKVNYLVDSAVRRFQDYVDTFKDKSDKVPDLYPSTYGRSVVLAHFYQGRLWNKRHTPDPKEKMGYLTKSLGHYQWIVDYCHKDENCAKEVQEELSLAEDMVRLMPLKMERLHSLT